ncbi:uncharacterized protein LOC106424074 isoform X5 [Brassica napus]|nr:uncharacterized protein LOC106424074 isoform X5 [Brassica napus]
MKSIVVILLTYLLLVAPCFAIGSENTNSDVYEIDYRGPETHNSRPPPETLHGKRPFIHHKTSAAGSAGAHVGGQKNPFVFKPSEELSGSHVRRR